MLEDAGQMMMDAGDAMTPDAGAQESEFFDFTCPTDDQWLLTDVDQRQLGKVVIHQDFPDPWGVTESKIVKAQQYAWWSVDGKVLVQCTPGRGFRVEVLP
jgi:hypothetical protein